LIFLKIERGGEETEVALWEEEVKLA